MTTLLSIALIVACLYLVWQMERANDARISEREKESGDERQAN
jgi:hypothetical protein